LDKKILKSNDVVTFGENKMSNEIEVMDAVAVQNYADILTDFESFQHRKLWSGGWRKS